MTERDSMQETILAIVNIVTGKTYVISDLLASKQPFIHIISDSAKATQFIVLLEEEFEIEFDDDEIDFEFFTDPEKIVVSIVNHLKNAQ